MVGFELVGFQPNMELRLQSVSFHLILSALKLVGELVERVFFVVVFLKRFWCMEQPMGQNWRMQGIMDGK